jgi:WD40 repeat protein
LAYSTAGYQAYVKNIFQNEPIFQIPEAQEWEGLKPLGRDYFLVTNDGRFLIYSCQYDKGQIDVISVWDITTTQMKLGEFTIPRHLSQTAAVHPSGKHLAYPIPGGIEIVTLPTGQIEKTIFFGTCSGNSIKLSPDGTMIASVVGRVIYLCNSSNGNLLHYINVPTATIFGIDWSPDSRLLASSGTLMYSRNTRGSPDSKIHIWDVATGQEVKVLDDHKGEPASVVFSPDGRMLATFTGRSPACYGNVGYESEINLWSISDGKLIGRYTPLVPAAGQIGFSNDSSRLVVSSGMVCSQKPNRVWWTNISTGHYYEITQGTSVSFVILDNGNLMTNADEVINVWDISGDRPISVDTPPNVGQSFSPTGKWEIKENHEPGAWGMYDKREVYLINTATGKQLTILEQEAKH